jgi:retron-type reverse transcriptase
MSQISREVISSIVDEVLEKEENLKSINREKIINFISQHAYVIDANIDHDELYRRIRDVMILESTKEITIDPI